MIRALSPFYVDTPLTYGASITCESFTLNIWVWHGDYSAPDSTNSYQITYENTSASTGSHKINIASVAKDFIEFNAPIYSLTSGTAIRNGGNNQAWVYTFVTYDSPLAVTRYHEVTDLMTLGYTYGDEGEQTYSTPDTFLLPNMDYKVNRDGVAIIPFYVGELDFGEVSVKSDVATLPEYVQAITADEDSGTVVRYLWIDLTNDFQDAEQYITVLFRGVTITLDLYEEARYTPMDIMFQNKEGALQSFTFFKDRKEETTITDSIYESNRGQGSQGYHQFLRYNVQARNSVTASTGFIHERENEIVQQILYSSRIWLYDPINEIYRAVNVKDTSKQFKTRLTERLINYTMKFEYAYNQINNI